MDFIIKKLDRLINVSEKNTAEMQTLLRERIEYIFYLVLGCLWNENIGTIGVDDRCKIVEDLNKLTIGQAVGAIRKLDNGYRLIPKKGLKSFEKYTALRNQTLGHGYVHSDNEAQLEKQLIELYSDLIQLNFLKQEYDMVCVLGSKEDMYTGLRFSVNSGGVPVKWACPIAVLGQHVPDNSVFLYDSYKTYYRVSPFIFIYNKGDEVFVFQSLLDKLSGNVKVNQLFRGATKEIRIEEFISLSYESERRRISSNKTIMNYFEKNYCNFITVPVEKKIEEFLDKNRSNVQATVWGHGGTGKTACVQNICMKKYDDLHADFSYIVFTSAKERNYDTKTGKIVEIQNIRTYEEILDSIIAVVFDQDAEGSIETKEEKILSIRSKILLVIDDYETFIDSEKEKIQNFIKQLNIDYFKVILTTRNRRLSTGVEIISDEFGLQETKGFLESVFTNEYSEYADELKNELEDKEILNIIHEATSGRAIFLYQFSNLYVQRGLTIDFLKELKNSRNAQEFLYGKIYTYLSNVAKKAFEIISQIAEEKDLIFKKHVLEFLLNDYDSEEVMSAIQELVDQKVIEQYDDDNYRVYSQDLFLRMKGHYDNEPQNFKDRIKGKITDIGGINIKGTVYEAMLEEANNSRNQGNVNIPIERYKRLLNDKMCEKNVKKRALINLTSYMNINLLDIEGAVQIFDDYVQRLGFQNDADVLKLYTQQLWSLDDTAKTKACDILERYFANKSNRKTHWHNLELFAMTVAFCSHNVMVNTPEKVKKSAEQRILNEYGRELYKYVISKNFSEFRPSIKHNVSIALINTAKLALELSLQGHDGMKLVRGIIAYGNTNFSDLFKRQISKLQYEIEKKKYVGGEYVNAVITYIAKYGVLVTVNNVDKAIIHNTEIPYGRKQSLKRGQTIRARVIGENEKGYMLSLKEEVSS